MEKKKVLICTKKNEEVMEMKKYTIDNYKEFCNDALVLPPLDDFYDGSVDEEEWYKTHKIHITVDNHDMELNYYADNVTEIYGALKEMYEIEMEVRGIKDNKEERNTEFKTKLTEAFKTHIFMKDRDYHTVNELLYVLEHDSRFNEEDFSISIGMIDANWCSIPTLEAFVSVETRGIWFNDADVEFEVEECGGEKYNCITVYEREDV